MAACKRFVYILKSLRSPDEYYTGLTSDPAARLKEHNAGLTRHTARSRPWKFLVVVEFDEQQPALDFERYLKTGSGREFARRHFRQTVAYPEKESPNKILEHTQCGGRVKDIVDCDCDRGGTVLARPIVP